MESLDAKISSTSKNVRVLNNFSWVGRDFAINDFTKVNKIDPFGIDHKGGLEYVIFLSGNDGKATQH